MAVYEHSYKRYTGITTAVWSRFLVLPKYGFKDVFKSRWLVFFFALSVLVPVIFAIMIYLRHNLDAIDALKAMGIEADQFFDIDAGFFGRFMVGQAQFAFFLTLFIGPGLVSRDLANNGLPLYLSRPISRADYVVGKLAILLILLSCITWVSGLLLFLLNSNFAGWSWMVENLNIAMAMVVGFGFWIGLLALLALALSAWVRWKVVAGFLMLAIFWTGDMMALMVNLLFRTDWGHIFNPDRLIHIVSATLLGVQTPNGPPVWAAVVSLSLLGLFCLYLLNRKIRAYQVVS